MTKIIIASGPVIVENNKVLLNQHGDDNFWKFCGGRVENEEIGLMDTARREVREEMGIEVEILIEEPFLTYASKELDDQKIDIILAHYLAKRIGEIKPGSDIKKWAWVDINSLEGENLAPNILPVLRHFGFVK